jgi:hypothetical protein
MRLELAFVGSSDCWPATSRYE